MSESEQPKAQRVDLSELPNETLGQAVIGSQKIDLVKNVKVKISAKLGEVELSVGELFDLKKNSIVKLNTETTSPIELYVDENCVARGNLVVVDENFGIEITEVLNA